MTLMVKKIAAGFVFGFSSAAVVDIRKWLKWRKLDQSENTKFDWFEAAITWMLGGFTGAMVAAGLDSAGAMDLTATL